GVVAVRSAAKCRSFDSLRSLRMTDIFGSLRMAVIFGSVRMTDIFGSLRMAVIFGSVRMTDIFGSVGMAVDGDYAAFFAEFGVFLGLVLEASAPKCRSFDSLRSLR